MNVLRRLACRRLAGIALAGVLAAASPGATAAPQDAPSAAGAPLPGTASLRATVFGPDPAALAELPARVPVRELNLDIGQRPVPELFWFNRKLRVWYSAQRGPAPLVVVISGVGGDGNSGKIPLLRAALYGAGYHVLTMPSPTFPRFIVAASSTGVAGDLAQDAADLERAIRHALAALPRKLRVTGLHLVGYSLGGAHAAMLKAHDTGPDPLGIGRVVMINPPVDLHASIGRFDAMFEASIGRDSMEIEQTFHRLYGDLSKLYREAEATTLDQEFLLGAAAHILKEDRELAAAISLSFRVALANMMFIGDYYARTGVLVDPAAPPRVGDPLDDYLRELRTMPFLEYFECIFAPYYLARWPGSTRDSLIAGGSLQRIADQLAQGGDYYAQHSIDDFILDRAELDWLREILGPRLAVYERGGHLGQMGERRQVEDMLAMLAGAWPGPGGGAP